MNEITFSQVSILRTTGGRVTGRKIWKDSYELVIHTSTLDDRELLIHWHLPSCIQPQWKLHATHRKRIYANHLVQTHVKGIEIGRIRPEWGLRGWRLGENQPFSDRPLKSRAETGFYRSQTQKKALTTQTKTDKIELKRDTTDPRLLPSLFVQNKALTMH